MIRWLRLSSIGLSLVAVLAVGVAQAQDTEGSAVPESASTKQKVEYAEKILAEMQNGIKDVDRILDAAKKSGDPDQIACVADKLASLKALKEVTERAQSTMILSLNKGDDISARKADTELRKIGIAASKFRQFYTEAQACVGEASVDGAADVKVSQEGMTDEGETDEQRGDIELDEDPPPYTPFE